MPSGTHVALESKYLDSIELVVISYKYNSKVTLYFIIIKNAGSIRKDNLYEIKFTNFCINMHARLVNCLSIISDFLKVSNYADKYN